MVTSKKRKSETPNESSSKQPRQEWSWGEEIDFPHHLYPPVELIEQEGDKHEVPQSTCLAHGLTKENLMELDFISVSNPYYRSAAPMKLFNTEQVNALIPEVWAKALLGLKHKWLAIRETRKATLERKKVNTGDILTPCARDFVLGRYVDFRNTLKPVKACKEKIIDIVYRYKNCCLLQDSIPETKTLMFVLRYCFINRIRFEKLLPTQQLVARAIGALDNTTKVFTTGGCVELIGSFLDKDDVMNFDQTFPQMKLSEYSSFLKAREEFNHYLSANNQLVLKVPKKLIEHWRRHYVNKKAFSNEMIMEMISYKKMSPDQRRMLLQQELKLRNLELRQDSTLCKRFVENSEPFHVKYVVGIMKVTSELFRHAGYYSYHDKFDEKYRMYLEKGVFTYEQALDTIIKDMNTFFSVSRKQDGARRRWRWHIRTLFLKNYTLVY